MLAEIMRAHYVLRLWKEAPNRARRTYVCDSILASRGNPNWPIRRTEVRYFKTLLKRYAPRSYHNLFPDEPEPPAPTTKAT